MIMLSNEKLNFLNGTVKDGSFWHSNNKALYELLSCAHLKTCPGKCD